MPSDTQNIDIHLSALTATEALVRLRAGSNSAEELAKACLNRIELRDPIIRAWSAVEPASVVAQARELDKVVEKKRLHGIPIGIKDVIDTAELPTTYNSPLYLNHRPARDAACVALLAEAGALILGKTDTVEFAAGGRRALSRNPHNPGHTPGGSSSGSAAAVADFHVPIALGTQSAGSVIRPASYCGTFAMKPSWGAVSREGVKLYSVSLDTIGWFARSVADLKLIADVLTVSMEDAGSRSGLRNARIAVCKTPAWQLMEPASVAALAKGAELLRSADVEVIELELPQPFDGLIEARRLIARAEGATAFLAEERRYGARLHPDVRAMVASRGSISASALRSAYNLAASCRAMFDEIAAEFDAILAPSGPGEAPAGLRSTGDSVLNEMWTLLHVPCINIPGLVGPNGLPVGLTLIGARFADNHLLSVAEHVARLFPRRPYGAAALGSETKKAAAAAFSAIK